ncbi:MAG TPA: Asp-tRNA(Asn)/Glu-tRNA(Gln) amidotransferase subunit GatC [Polyangiaceae bacterium]|jgi:aspartyl-tRNA(Asn)/glutamyl-tRNA(Gln) amidotransferase subunit C
MTIERNDVLHIARLARVSLEPEEVPALMRELAAILEYMDLLNEIETDSVEPTAHVAVTELPLRADAVSGELERDVVLEQAPRAGGGGFAVPTFIDES